MTTSSQFDMAVVGVSIAASLAVCCFLAWRYIASRHRRPRFTEREIVFQERFASGRSQKNFLTKIAGANNCLRLVVTREFLWVTTWAPLIPIASFFDLEHTIPLRSITSVKRERFFGRTSFVVTYVADDGISHSVKLMPWKQEAFVNSLGVEVMAKAAAP